MKAQGRADDLREAQRRGASHDRLRQWAWRIHTGFAPSRTGAGLIRRGKG